jgi:hypothetical protein
VFEGGQWDLVEWVTIVEIEELGFEELIGGVCVEQVRVEDHEWSRAKSCLLGLRVSFMPPDTSRIEVARESANGGDIP